MTPTPESPTTTNTTASPSATASAWLQASSQLQSNKSLDMARTVSDSSDIDYEERMEDIQIGGHEEDGNGEDDDEEDDDRTNVRRNTGHSVATSKSHATTAAAAVSKQHEMGLRDPLFPAWTNFTLLIHRVLATGVTVCAVHAARHPKAYLIIITTLALTLQVAGFFTNFNLNLDLDAIFTPVGSYPQRHYDWISSPTGFPDEVRSVQMIFHREGANVLHVAQARRVLQAVDTVRSTEGYQELCSKGQYVNFNDEATCRIISVSGYWKNHSLNLFDEQVGNDNNDDLLRYTISAKEFADGGPVLHDVIVGNYNRNTTTKILDRAESYLVQIDLPRESGANAFEQKMLARLDTLRRQWLEDDKDKDANDPTALTVDIMTIYAYQLELMRTLLGDLYLVPICIVLMVGFTCLIFYRHGNAVQSRSTLGLCSVVTICMSVMTGNGLMFLIGVPYSAVHQMLPFVVFGIGLDDTFIITGAYFRTNPNAPIEDRIRTTMQEIGPSISLTTITTIFAFLLGYISSSFPGVHWLCLYAVCIIGADFYYQITYFVAFLVLDERRVQKNRRDCCCWITVKNQDDDEFDNDADADEVVVVDFENSTSNNTENIGNRSLTSSVAGSHHEETGGFVPVTEQPATPLPPSTAAASTKTKKKIQKKKKKLDVPLPVKIMRAYSEFLLRDWVRIAVLVVFSTFFAWCCYSATLLEQHFNVADYVSADSYLANVFSSLDEYSSVVRPMGIYFRNVDQTDPVIQQQMIDYVNELERLDQIGGPSNITMEELQLSDEIRPFCWVRDLQEMEKSYDNPVVQQVLANMSFIEKLDFALTDKVAREVYGQDIVRDETGNITASRCFLFLKNLDLESVQSQIDMLFDQRAVTENQPINQLPESKSKGNWKFFCFEEIFFYWEAYAVAVQELVWTIIAGVAAVCAISFIFIPHWTSVCFVFPMIVVLYIDLLGVVRFFGLDINGLTYICVVVAIGLLVDFLMHVLLRYYESSPHKSREDRVKETLQTMGVSILVGGTSTLLGVIPLALSSLQVFLTAFYAFFAMVVLGCTHGLILLPVVLSYAGPSMAVRGHHLAPPLEMPDMDESDDEDEAPEKEEKPEPIRTSLTQDTEVSAGSDNSSWVQNVTNEIEV